VRTVEEAISSIGDKVIIGDSITWKNLKMLIEEGMVCGFSCLFSTVTKVIEVQIFFWLRELLTVQTLSRLMSANEQDHYNEVRFKFICTLH
jgi:hypothetical protein